MSTYDRLKYLFGEDAACEYRVSRQLDLKRYNNVIKECVIGLSCGDIGQIFVYSQETLKKKICQIDELTLTFFKTLTRLILQHKDRKNTLVEIAVFDAWIAKLFQLEEKPPKQLEDQIYLMQELLFLCSLNNVKFHFVYKDVHPTMFSKVLEDMQKSGLIVPKPSNGRLASFLSTLPDRWGLQPILLEFDKSRTRQYTQLI